MAAIQAQDNGSVKAEMTCKIVVEALEINTAAIQCSFDGGGCSINADLFSNRVAKSLSLSHNRGC